MSLHLRSDLQFIFILFIDFCGIVICVFVVWFVFQRQGLMQPRLAWNSCSSSLHLSSAGITNMHQCSWSYVCWGSNTELHTLCQLGYIPHPPLPCLILHKTPSNKVSCSLEGFELSVLLPSPPKFWDHRGMYHPTQFVFGVLR